MHAVLHSKLESIVLFKENKWVKSSQTPLLDVIRNDLQNNNLSLKQSIEQMKEKTAFRLLVS